MHFLRKGFCQLSSEPVGPRWLGSCLEKPFDSSSPLILLFFCVIICKCCLKDYKYKFDRGTEILKWYKLHLGQTRYKAAILGIILSSMPLWLISLFMIAIYCYNWAMLAFWLCPFPFPRQKAMAKIITYQKIN